MRRPTGVELHWFGDLLLAVTYGDFDYQASVQTTREMITSIEERGLKRWALLAITTAQHYGGSLSTPDALQHFQELVNFLARSGISHAALLNESIVADTSYGNLYSNAGINQENFRDLTEALAWLKKQGYVVAENDVLTYVPRDV